MTQALKKSEIISLDEILFQTSEECASSYPEQAIFEIKKSDHIPMGFTSLAQLRQFAMETDSEELNNLVIRNTQSTHWISLFEHPSFQRRKPQLVPFDSIQAEDDKEYYILSKGQKHGPYEKIQLQAMLEQNEILLTDMVSGNAGHTWMKVFQLDGFERRALKDSQELPEMPLDVIKEGNENVISLSASTEAITNLAYLSNVKKSKSAKVIAETIQNKITNSVSSTQALSKWILFLSLIGIVYFAFNIKNQLKSPFANNEPTVGEHAENPNIVETLRPVESFDAPIKSNHNTPSVGESHRPNSINDQGRFETKKLEPIRPHGRKSFMQTQTFKNTQTTLSESGNQGTNEYYDDTTPMELDPVRAQVNKETYNDAGQEDIIPTLDSIYEEEVNN